MASHFRTLPIKDIRRETSDCVSISFAIPVGLRDEFLYKQGQNVTIRSRIGGEEIRRSYSICSSPHENELRIAIKKVSGGRFSSFANERLREGEELEVLPPTGRFYTELDPSRRKNYLAFAAGSGITPILSLATDILAREPRGRFTLIYGNRSISRTMFLEETLGLKNRYIDRFSVHFVMSREPQQTEWLNGRIDGHKIRELARHMPEVSSADEYLICGPGDMVDEVRNAVKTLNGSAQIRFERFAAAAPRPVDNAGKERAAAPGAATAPPAPAPESVLATISVVMDGRRRSFAMAQSDASVLDAAERAGLELPFSCRSGICATCRARITDGAAVMTHNIALEPWETDAGFVLCCQARPTTATLEISYDHK